MKITSDEIKENITFAAEIMRRLPAVKMQGYLCAWPSFCRSCEEMQFAEDVWLPPLPHEISAMEKILEWLKFTSLENRRIIWLRACGMGWKTMSGKYKKGRSTLIREYNIGIKEIETALNDEKNSEKYEIVRKLTR